MIRPKSAGMNGDRQVCAGFAVAHSASGSAISQISTPNSPFPPIPIGSPLSGANLDASVTPPPAFALDFSIRLRWDFESSSANCPRKLCAYPSMSFGGILFPPYVRPDGLCTYVRDDGDPWF